MDQKDIHLYFRPLCGFCAAAERLLTSKGYTFTKTNIWEVPGAKEEMIVKTGGKTSVPQIFADEAYVGDCSGIHDLDAAGKLDALLQRA